MRKFVFAVAVMLLGTAAASAQEPWGNKLFANKTTHDFGNVARGPQLKFSFPIKNIYAVQLTIQSPVRVSCGCLTATPSKNVLESQEEAVLNVVMDTTKFIGPKKITVYVTFNNQQYISTAVLTVSANARGDVTFNPGDFNFGNVLQGSQAVQTVEVDYIGFLDFRVKEVIKPADAPFTVTMEELYRNAGIGNKAGRIAYKMTVKLNPDAAGGPFKHSLILKTNDPQSEQMLINVEGNVLAALTVSPTQVNLSGLKVNEAKTFKVLVSGQKPFRITEIKCDGNDITGELPQQAQTVHTLTLKCLPAAAGKLTRQLTIVTDMDKGASVTVTVQGNAQ